jgi:tetratricopeptide (TPR) repeat protein
MIHKYVLGIVAFAALVATASISTVAQVGELRGQVVMQQADGQKVPLADAAIDVFRTDMKAEYKTKTNKKGEFVFAGLPFVGTYTVAASHATAKPNFVTGVKAGRDIPVEIIVTPGDGKRFTADELKTVVPSNPAATGSGGSSGGGSGETAAQKAEREKLIAKNKEIEEKNKKIEASNAIVMRTFKSGNDALAAASEAMKANNSAEAVAKYSEAITQYGEGLAADPEQPALLTNQAMALKARGVEKYNTYIRTASTDEAGSKTAKEGALADFKASAESSTKAITLLKAMPTPTDPAEQQRLNSNKYAAYATNVEAMRLYATKGDPTQIDAALQAYKEYISLEPDPAKKAKAQLDSAQMLLDAGSADKAFAEFQSILTTQPENPDANLGAGLSLYSMGDKAKYQDAANYLQKFVDVAPDTHKFKNDAKQILLALKESEKVVPEKTPAPKRKRP